MGRGDRVRRLEAATSRTAYHAVCEQWERPDGTLTEPMYLIYARWDGDFTGGARNQAEFEAFAAQYDLMLVEHTIWTIPAGERAAG